MTEINVAPENLEATEAWNGPLFDIWQSFQAVVVSNAKAHGDAALADHHPDAGDRVLDIGCGLGDSTVQLARLVGPEGHAHGVDVAERMIVGAREAAASSGVENVSFEAVDVQAASFIDNCDYAFGRFRDDVLRQPRGGPSQCASSAAAWRTPKHGGLAPQA